MKYRDMIRNKYAEVYETMRDEINNPPHYNSSVIEAIDMIESATEEGFEHYLQGNILKYMIRYRHKNGIEDLKKAQWYLNKLIYLITPKCEKCKTELVKCYIQITDFFEYQWECPKCDERGLVKQQHGEENDVTDGDVYAEE